MLVKLTPKFSEKNSQFVCVEIDSVIWFNVYRSIKFPLFDDGLWKQGKPVRLNLGSERKGVKLLFLCTTANIYENIVVVFVLENWRC